MAKILFILKRREDYNAVVHTSVGLSTGLYNSALFVSQMLNMYGLDSRIIVVTDNNDIDREVTKHKPTHVIIEALWVVPEKFHVLSKLHPKVKWIIRFHSELPFMSNEGIAMDWIGEYVKYNNVYVAFNAPRMKREIQQFIKNLDKPIDIKNKIIYLPNYYYDHFKKKRFDKYKEHLDIGCFGAIRPLKNHLLQAEAALETANYLGKKLRFHINAGRIEMKGEPIVHNLKGMFQHLHHKGHELINHQWVPRNQFIKTCGEMDIGMQVSFSETFNIVACDFLSQGVPVIGSSEIPWMPGIYCADPASSKDIVEKLLRAFHFPQLNVKLNKYYLRKYINETIDIWLRELNGI